MPKATRSGLITIISSDPKAVDEMKGWLKPYSSLVQVDAFHSLRVAVPMLEKFPSSQLLVSDRFPEASGLSLYQGLRCLSPKAQVYMLAAEQTPIAELAVAAKQETRLRYFTQPWDQHGLLAQVEANLGYATPVYTVALDVDEAQQLEIGRQLDELQANLSPQSMCLMTDLGQVLAYRGETELAQIAKISLLLGGSFAALQQVGLTRGDLGPASSLIQRQSDTEDIYVLGVGERALLFLLFPHGPSTPRMGTVAYYARSKVQALAKILGVESKGPAADTPRVTAVAKSNKNYNQPEKSMSFTRAFKEGYVTMGLIDRFKMAKSSAGSKNSSDDGEWLDLENPFSATPEQQQAIEKIVAHLKAIKLDVGNGNEELPLGKSQQ